MLSASHGVIADSWPDLGWLLSGCRDALVPLPFAGMRNAIMVKMVPMDDHLLLQWMAPQSFKEPRMLDLDVNDYVDTPRDTAGDGAAASSFVHSINTAQNAAHPCTHVLCL